MIGTAIAIAVAELLRNRSRSLLTMLGIVFGVAAVVMMQAMGGGVSAYIGETISGMGTNMLYVIPGAVKGIQQSTVGAPLFTEGDLDAIRRQARDVALVSAAGNQPVRAVAGPYNRTVTTIGADPEYFAIRSLGVERGRLISPEDDRQAAAVCIVGKTVAEALYPGADPVGAELRLQRMSCRVVGLAEAKGANAFGIDQDDVVYVPYSTFARRLTGTDRIAAMMVMAVAPDRIDAAKEEMSELLRRRRHIAPNDEDNFAIRDPREMQALLDSVTGMLTTLLAGVAAISLLVGGIGIMNIMLVSVTERTREIGVRLAIGARTRDVLTQFLVEATTLSALGGGVGVALGLGGALAVARALHVPFVVPLTATPLAFAVSVAVGVVFGIFPARKAAHLHPLAALRHE